MLLYKAFLILPGSPVALPVPTSPKLTYLNFSFPVLESITLFPSNVSYSLYISTLFLGIISINLDLFWANFIWARWGSVPDKLSLGIATLFSGTPKNLAVVLLAKPFNVL